MISSALLARIELFDGVSEKQREEIARISDEIQTVAGETIFREGAGAEHFYILLQGEVAIQIGLSSKPEVVTVSLIKLQHQGFGWSGVVAPYHYTAQAMSKTDCTLLAIQGQELLKLLRSEPESGFEVMLRITEVISSRLHNSRAALLRTI
jgi:CRP-like cAMP-binding protein